MDKEAIYKAVFDEVLTHFDDSPAKLGRALSESTPLVCNWRSRGIPANRCMAVKALTGIPTTRLRPFDWHEYWPEDKPAKVTA